MYSLTFSDQEVAAMDGTVLICDYSVFEREKIKQILQRRGNFDIAEASSYSQYHAIISRIEKPCLILMDLAFPAEKDGLTVLTELRESELFKDVPVVVISKLNTPELKKQALKLSVDDYILKPYPPQRLEDSIASFIIPKREFVYKTDTIRDITMTFEEFLTREFNISSRLNAPLSFLILTSINLKIPEDTSTGAIGEQLSGICTQFTDIIRQCLRSTDSVFLNGGREIIIILPGTDHPGAQTVREKINSLLKEALSSASIKPSEVFYPVAVTYPQDGASFQLLMEAAFKKIADKEMLDKITSIPIDTRNLARKRYNQFRRWF